MTDDWLTNLFQLRWFQNSLLLTRLKEDTIELSATKSLKITFDVKPLYDFSHTTQNKETLRAGTSACSMLIIQA